MSKVEKGVMIVKDGKAWGENGHGGYGWVDMEDGLIKNPDYCKKTTDVVWKGSPYIKELKMARLVEVERVTYVELVNGRNERETRL